MTDVSYSDTPNDPLVPLVHGPLEPIGFSCLRALDWLMVDMGAGFEECAFREGAFRGPYAAHSSISGDLLTGVVFREGGWLAPPKLIPQIVPETVVLPTTGQTMGTIYEVDLTAQPSQSLATSGSYAIDGKEWWVKGNNGTGGITELVNGAGLRIYQPPTVDAANAWALWRNQGIGTLYKARLFSCALAQLANYNPLAPLVVLWRFTSNQNAADDPGAFAGLGNIVPSAAVLTGAEKNTCLTTTMAGGVVGYRLIPPYSTTFPYKVVYVSTVAGNHVNGIYRILNNRFALLHNKAVWSGAMPSLDDMGDVDPNDAASYYAMSDAPNLSASPSFIFGIQKGFNGPDLDVHLTHMQILQPRVAA